MSNYSERLHKVIPGGAHTYSRGDDQFPSNAPPILYSGKRAYVFDDKNKTYLDYGMALRAITLGYADEAVNAAAIEQISKGNNLTRPSLIELEAAELLVSLIDSVDMVKFAKNGSSAVSAAIKLSRAYTGRELVVRCSQHPFFSYDDWFIGSTVVQRGIPDSTIKQTLCFNYNDIESLERVIQENPGKISCVILEPTTGEEPTKSKYFEGKNFLHDVKEVCEKNGIVFILDEMITGFRWHLKGAQYFYDVEPHLCTFGKAMANGFSLAAVAGKKEIMELGGIKKSGEERVFLLSSTHGAEMSALGAFVKTVEILQRENVIDHLWDYGKKLTGIGNELSKEYGIQDYFGFTGPSCSPSFFSFDREKKPSLEMRTLFSQEMINNNVIMPWVALSFSHGEEELEKTANALNKALKVYRDALDGGVEKYLKGPSIKPVFRKYN